MTASENTAAPEGSTGLCAMEEGQRSAILEATPWTEYSADDLGQAAMVPTMLNMAEQSYYVWLTKNWAQGQGAIVDLGSFAGGSAACLAEGVRQAGRAQVVHGYDKYEAGDFSAFRKRYDDYLAKPPASQSSCDALPLMDIPDTDILPVAQSFLAPWGDAVTLIKGQIETMVWSGGPIEILVLDASKTAATMDQMSATFFPHLIPGQSIIVQQDYFWWQQPWIAAQMAHLSEYFAPVAYVPRYSMSFLCLKTPPQSVMDDLRIASLPDREMIAAIRASKEILKDFPVERLARRLIRATKANPKERKAYRMKKP